MATKNKHWWRPNVERALKAYPSLKDRKLAMQSPALTPNYNPMPGGSEPSRTTENLGIRQLSEQEESWLQAIDRAKDDMKQVSDGAEILALVKMVFFNQTHTVTGAAMERHVSLSTAQRRIGRFIDKVAEHKGYKGGR